MDERELGRLRDRVSALEDSEHERRRYVTDEVQKTCARYMEELRKDATDRFEKQRGLYAMAVDHAGLAGQVDDLAQRLRDLTERIDVRIKGVIGRIDGLFTEDGEWSGSKLEHHFDGLHERMSVRVDALERVAKMADVSIGALERQYERFEERHGKAGGSRLEHAERVERARDLVDIGAMSGEEFSKVTGETVNHPAHYNAHPSGVECVQISKHFPHCLASAIEYVWRAGLKPGADIDEDLRKAIWWLEEHRATLKGER